MQAREYANATEMLESYAARRRRLFGPPPAPVKLKRPRLTSYAPAPLPMKPYIPDGASDWECILAEVAAKHGLTVEDLTGISRAKEILPARREAAYRMSHELSMTLVDVGRNLGRRNHKTVSIAIAKHALLVARTASSKRDLDQRDIIAVGDTGRAMIIIAQVAARYGVSVPQIRGAQHTVTVSLARDEALYLCSTQTNLSQRAIGMLFGNREHSTVSKAVCRYARRLDAMKEAA